MNSHEKTAIDALHQVSSTQQLPEAYNTVAKLYVASHDFVLGSLSDWTLGFNTSGLGLDEYLLQQREQVNDTLLDSTRKVDELVKTAREIVDGLIDLSIDDRKVYGKARTNGPGNYTDKYVLPLASSSQARSAIRIALDAAVYGKARTNGPGNYTDKYVLPLASSRSAKDAISNSLDDFVIKKTKVNGPGNYTDKYVLPLASSRSARAIIVDNMGPPRENRARHSRSGHSSNTGQNTSGSSRQRQNAHRAGTEQTPPSAYDKLMNDLRHGGDRSKLETVRGFERLEVVMVLNTVKEIRERNPEITDREIALRFLKRSNNTAEATEAHKRSTQIVLTLMGGKVSGTFPF